MKPYKKYRDLVGNTPIIDLTHLAEDVHEDVQILAKCEFTNPGYSVKDRIVAHIFDKAEEEGRLRPGSRVLAASSGNTGAAVAMMAAWRGYKAFIVTSPKCSQEKMDAIRAYGAELVVAGSYMAEAEKMAEEDPDLFDVDQYANPLNPEAHYHSLGPEIWDQTKGAVTHFTCGASTGGTICGVSKYLKEQKGEVEVVMADPVGSVFYEYFRTGCLGEARPFHVEGVGKAGIPKVMDFELVDDVIQVSDQEAVETCRKLAQDDGLMVGGSSGLNVYSALKLARRQKEPATIVTVLVDSGLKYISKIYNDDWVAENVYQHTCK
ncbi:MAG: cysteine synthase family protein [Acidobacteriota bacterium]|nr:cysteine synthase family protein [Acidobacteriota bacterium]